MKTETRSSRIHQALINIATLAANQHREMLNARQEAVNLAAKVHAEACEKVKLHRRAESFLAALKSAIANVVFVAQRYPGRAEKLPIGFDSTEADPVDVGGLLYDAYKDDGDMKANVWVLGQMIERVSSEKSDCKCSDAVKKRNEAKDKLSLARNSLEKAKIDAEDFITQNTSPDSATRKLLRYAVPSRGKGGETKAPEVTPTVVEVPPPTHATAAQATITLQPVAAVRAA